MNTYQPNDNNPNNQTIYPNQQPNMQPGMQPGMQPNPPQPPKKPNNALIIGIAAAAAVLVVICAILVAYNAGKSNSSGGSGIYSGPGTPAVSQSTPDAKDDAKTNTASSSETEKQPEPAPAEQTTPAPQTSGEYSRKNPAPVGTEQILVYEDEYDETRNFTVAVTVKEVIRGETAMAMIKEANSFNDPADEGYEYVLAKIGMTLISMNAEKAFEASAYDFTSFTSNNEEIDYVSVIEPEPNLEGKLYEGGSTEGWAAFQVKIGDVSPKLAYNLEYDGSGGLWFALQ